MLALEYDIELYDGWDSGASQVDRPVIQSLAHTVVTPSIQYIETVERMFKNKIPGAKATYFNIKLCGTHITDTQTRNMIEQELRVIVSKIKPAYTNLLGIQWVD